MDVSDEEWDGEVIAPMVKRQKVVVGIPVVSVAVAAPAERVVKEKKKRYDQGKKWFDKTIKKGKKMGKNKFGVWRRVPGFPKRTIRVSSKGWVRQWCTKRKAWEHPKRGSEGADYYLKIYLQGSKYYVAILINRAFHGAPPSKKHTTDHIAKYGNKRKERQDNRSKNLKWEDKSGQVKNRTLTDAPRSDDRPLEVCSEWPREGWTPGEWVWFQSQQKAAEAMGVARRSVRNWLSGNSCSMGWAVRWAPPAEPKDDLPATDEDPAEVWIKVDDTTWVSNRGRAWQPYRKSEAWRKFTPRATEGTGGYPTITACGKEKQFHLVLFDAFFFPGVRGNRTIDHINRDRGDARLSNLRPATASEQSLNRTHKAKGDGNKDSQKTRIKYRRADAPDDAPWERCLGAAELARRLTHATAKAYSGCSISAASNGEYGKRCKNPHKYKDYVFYKI
jgi:hypothetical protein